MNMSKINLANVTLMCVTGKDISAHYEALDKSCEGIFFGEVISVQKDFKSIDEWNEFIIYHLKDYFTTSHCLLIHADGYVIHPEIWKDKWLQYDYAGSPWPLPQDDFSYRDEEGDIQRVGNSVGLRSKKLMELIATRPWKSYYGNTNEDGFITCHNRKWLESKGCNFMPFEEALLFGRETPLPEYTGNTFLFHSI